MWEFSKLYGIYFSLRNLVYLSKNFLKLSLIQTHDCQVNFFGATFDKYNLLVNLKRELFELFIVIEEQIY